MRYCPPASVTPVRTLVMSAGLDASTVTPGSTAPDVSRTVPARLCAATRVGSATSAVIATSNRLSTDLITGDLLDRWILRPWDPFFAYRRGRDYGPLP